MFFRVSAAALMLLFFPIFTLAGGESTSMQLHSGHTVSEDSHSGHTMSEDSHSGHTMSADSPSGHTMSGHAHKKGGWMFSYRTMDMHMEDSIDGDRGISSDEIATTAPNRFYGISGQPATLRVVPVEMDSRMDMFSLMYAQTDTISWMLMLHHIEKSMQLTTYMGASGATRRGTFKTKSSGMGDTSISVLWEAFKQDRHQVRFNFGLSLPTGDIDQKDTVLSPMGMTPQSVLPYSMQLGSGTYDLLPGVTYSGNNGHFVDWGVKYQAVMRVGENDEDYTLGDKHRFSAWGGYTFAPWIKTSLGLSHQYEGDIDGIDSRIILPLQTADPDNYGGDSLVAHWGVTLFGQKGQLQGHKIEIEYSKQLDRNANGIQMEMDGMFAVGYQFGF